jgi:hypothetical protein
VGVGGGGGAAAADAVVVVAAAREGEGKRGRLGLYKLVLDIGVLQSVALKLA